MKLVYLLEPGDTIQDKDQFFRPATGEWVELNIANPKFAPMVAVPDLPTIREVYTEDIFKQLKSQYDEGLSEEEIKAGIESIGMLCFEGKKDLLEYVERHFDISKVLEVFDEDDVEDYLLTESTAIDAETGSKGASFWKDECRELLREVIIKQGWDAVYNRIKDLDYMQPDSGPSLFSETELTDYSTKSNFIP